ncbi:MAG: hypothetical protein J5570_09090 [Lachnospiraceae bacterium]|nr:hypothetical protein [Lachnospiraceae bacterium]
MRETDLNCPFCGTPHNPAGGSAPSAPQTMYELRKFADAVGISLERIHFHLGEDYKGRCAFGMYRDEKTGNYVVYKNKDNGKRAIRYEGPDEAYAVNELYQKLKERMTMYRNNPMNRHTDLYKDPKPDLVNMGSTKTGIIIVVIVTVFIILLYMLSYSIGYIPNSGGGGSSTRYESSYDNDSDYSYSDWGSDSGSDYDDWSSDW